MKKNLILYILLLFLILVNGFFLYNYIGKPHMKVPPRPSDFIANQLNFDGSQMEEFLKIDKSHREITKDISIDLKDLKDALFNNLSNATINNQKIDSITTLIGNKEKERDMEVFHYFRKIYTLCNEKQKKHFKKIVREALHGNDKRGPRPPRRE